MRSGAASDIHEMSMRILLRLPNQTEKPELRLRTKADRLTFNFDIHFLLLDFFLSFPSGATGERGIGQQS